MTKLALTFFPPFALSFLSSLVILGLYAGLFRTRFLCFSPVPPAPVVLRFGASPGSGLPECSRSETGEADRERVKSSMRTVVMSSVDSYAASAREVEVDFEGPAVGTPSSPSASESEPEPPTSLSERSLSTQSDFQNVSRVDGGGGSTDHRRAPWRSGRSAPRVLFVRRGSVVEEQGVKKSRSRVMTALLRTQAGALE